MTAFVSFFEIMKFSSLLYPLMSTMFNLVPAHLGSEKSSKTGQSQGEF